MIYDKENEDNPYNIPVNKGNEASVYLKYIIDHYDTLTEFTYFIHDDEKAWHHTGSVIDKFIYAIESKKKYFNINDKCINTIDVVLKECIRLKCTDEFKAFYKDFIEEYVPFKTLDKKKEFLGSAQFLVHKSFIQKIPKEHYEKLYDWIINTELKNSVSGRFLEWTWHILWKLNETQP